MKYALRLSPGRTPLRGLLAVAAVAFGSAFVFLSHAAVPPSATIGPNDAPVNWIGSAAGGGAPNEAACVDGVNCDVFKITVGGTAADWAAKFIVLNFAWNLPASDYDFYIRKDSVTGPITGNGRNDGAPSTDDDSAIDPAATGVGDYFVHVVYFSATAADQYRGTATVTAKTAAVRNATYESSGITFSPNQTVKAPVSARDGEPSIRTDYKGNSYVGGIRGVPAGVDLWYFNLNPASASFDPQMRVPAYRGQPDGTTEKTEADAGGDGGGDIDLAVGFPPASGPERDVPFLAYSSLTLANISTGRTQDRGVTFELNPVGNLTGGPPGDDRQWHEFLGSDSVYLLYRTVAPAIAQVQRSNDGGFTYGLTASIGLIGQVGCIDVHQATGTVYASGSNGVVAVGKPSAPGGTPAASDYIIRQAATDPNGVAHLFFVVKVADDGTPNGTAYVAYSNATNVFLKHSTDGGATWSAPVRVDPPTGPYANKINLFPWIETGPTPGSVGLVWYGTTNELNNDDAKWKVFFAQSFNGSSENPTFRVAEVTEPEHFIHGSNISEMGLNPTGGSNRNLIDYFQLSFDPSGAAVIAYTDDHNDFDGNVYVSRQIGGPSIEGGNLPAVAEGAQLALPPAAGGVGLTDVFPPRQPGYNGEQVTDFPLDVQTALFARVPTADSLDLKTVRYDTSGTGDSLAIAATMRTTDLTVIPPGSFWRASFAVNAPNAVLSADGSYTFAVSDDADQFYVEAQTTDGGVQTFVYGTAVRNPDGTITYTEVGAADAGEFNMTDQTISIQVSVAKLNAILAANNRPLIAHNTIVSGLRARAVTVDIVAPPPAGRQGRRDLTRGGTQFAVRDFALPEPAPVPAPTPLPPRAGNPGPVSPAVELANISSRVAVDVGERQGIAGFIVRKDAPKRLLIRGAGPSLTAFNVPNTLQDPVIEVRNATTNALIASNDNWRSTQQAAITATGLAPRDNREAAVIVNLDGNATLNNYTAHLRGADGTPQAGIGVIEVYDLDAESLSDLGNISTRAFVGTGDNILIGGLIIRDDSSNNQSQDILLRGMGPTLGKFNVANPLANPQITLFDAQGNQIAANDDWQVNQDPATIPLPPGDPKEAALRRTLAPGRYTVHLTGVGNTTGVACVEVYNLGNAP